MVSFEEANPAEGARPSQSSNTEVTSIANSQRRGSAGTTRPVSLSETITQFAGSSMSPKIAGSEARKTLASKSTTPEKPRLRRSSSFHNKGEMIQSVRDQLFQERESQVKEEQEKHGVSRLFAVARRLVDSKLFVFCTTLLTVYALTADDVRLMVTNKPADGWFNACLIVCLTVFTVEIVLSCLGKADYFLGFFFCLDFLSTATLVLDLTWVNDFFFNSDEEDTENMKGTRTARIGARAARIVRVIRLVRILKLYKAIYEARAHKKKQQGRGTAHEDWDEGDADFDETRMMLRESQVGKRLSELTTRRVIVLVLTMMLGLQFLQLDKAEQFPTATAYGADLVLQAFRKMEADASKREAYERTLLQYVYYHNWFTAQKGCTDSNLLCPADYYSNIFWVGIAGQEEAQVAAKASLAKLQASTVEQFDSEAAVQDAIYSFGTMPPSVLSILSSSWNTTCRTPSGMLRLGVGLLRDEIENLVSYAVECPEDLRPAEVTKYSARLVNVHAYSDWHFAFYVDNRHYTQELGLWSIITTAFICVVLLVASMFFAEDASALVLKPVESMILKVDMIRINPLYATKLADDAFKAEEIQKAKVVKQQGSVVARTKSVVCCMGDATQQPMETIILEKTIIKLGTLLVLGFGEAGANIIGQNMSGADSAVVNAMIPGQQVECIIASARIRDFSVATEVLQVNVMGFVNQVAEIVHGVVDEYHGSPNKNNGDTFLAIWAVHHALQNPQEVAKLGDMSMMAMARIFGAIHRSRVLAVYRGHPGLQQRLGRQTRVNMTFGLHYGWAIEGAVGSEFKIDASYLSPNVNIAECVERAAESYGVAVLITESVRNICSPAMATKCRLIDRVTIRGSKQPLELYCIDLSHALLALEEPRHNYRWNSRQRFRCRQFLEAEKARLICEDCDIANLFDTNSDVIVMRRPYTLEFMQVFKMGYQNYSQGEWQTARRILCHTSTMLGFEDGPSATLLRYMEEFYDFVETKKWAGVHALKPTGQLGPPVNPSFQASYKKNPQAIGEQSTRLRPAWDSPSGGGQMLHVASASETSNAAVTAEETLPGMLAAFSLVPRQTDMNIPTEEPTRTKSRPLEDLLAED